MPLIARRDVPEDVDSRISGTPDAWHLYCRRARLFSRRRVVGREFIPCKMLLIQVSGSRGGKDTWDARAVVSWNGGYVGTTESNPQIGIAVTGLTQTS